MSQLKRLLPFMRPYRWQAIGAMVLLLGVVVADLLIPRLTQRVIDQGIAQQDMPMILNTALAMLGASALSALFSVGNTLLSVRVAMPVSADIRGALVRQVQTYSFAELDRTRTGELLVRATSDVSQVQMFVQMSLRILTRAPLWMLGSMLMLIVTSRDMAWLMLGLLPIVGLIVWLFFGRARRLFASVQARLDRLNQVMQENLAGVRVVKAFVRAEHEMDRFGAANVNLTQESIRVMMLVAILAPSMMALVNFATVGVIWIGGAGVAFGRFTTGEIVASVNYMSFSLFPLLMLAGMAAPIAAADASAGRILQILDSETDVKDHPEARLPLDAGGRVEFNSVWFSYDQNGGEPVLQDINLVAEPGQTVAILGATGSGKSSLVHLIPRYYDISAGRILVDGVDVREIPLTELRGMVGVALQDAVLFSGTVADNIRFGRPDASDEETVEAAKIAQAHEFISASPHGYDSVVDQRGVNLSGGQRQRVSIARSFLVRPRVLILDDSTSAVDVETEARIQDALHGMRPRVTTFIIAQRVSTVLTADTIIVLEEGRIAAQGRHEELLKHSQVYREIFESQLGTARGASGMTPVGKGLCETAGGETP
jgi:ATP-binding cassette subfamily B multidrug efflux pump